MKLCECGCGQPVKPGKRFVAFHHLQGATNPRYRGGIYFSNQKRRWIIICRDGSRQYYARAIMEAIIKRSLRPEEVVHHIDGDTTNDDPSNLCIMARPDHDLLSATKYTAESLLEHLRRFFNELGRPPRCIDFMADPATWPHPSTYRRFFGRWNTALAQAGIPLHREARWHK